MVAVTQNLARLPDAFLAKCAVSASDLDSVNPATALDRAMSGEGEVNPAYRDWPTPSGSTLSRRRAP
jgi:hypothetical protein